MQTKDKIAGMLTAKEVAELLNVHINTVRRWSKQGVLRSYRLGPRGDRRFKREDVTVILREGNGGGNKEYG